MRGYYPPIEWPFRIEAFALGLPEFGFLPECGPYRGRTSAPWQSAQFFGVGL